MFFVLFIVLEIISIGRGLKEQTNEEGGGGKNMDAYRQSTRFLDQSIKARPCRRETYLKCGCWIVVVVCRP